jgi:cyanate permease
MWLMATLGISAGIGSFAVSALSDRVGRKPTIVVFSLLGVILPLGAMLVGNAWLLALIFFVGWALNGVFPLFMATIPSESVDPRLTASLTGIVMGIGEVLGGVLGPSIAGVLSDGYGRSAVMWMMLVLCTLAGIVGMGLRETAPRVLARRAGPLRAVAAGAEI